MSLDRCTECGTVEGGWKTELRTVESIDERFALLKDAEELIEVCVCMECGGIDCREGIPEYDDWDMDR